MNFNAWVALPSYVVMALVLVMLAVNTAELRRLRNRPPEIIREPERCASCGGVLPKGETPVEFTGVPVPALMGKELTVHFKACQSCVAMT